MEIYLQEIENQNKNWSLIEGILWSMYLNIVSRKDPSNAQ